MAANVNREANLRGGCGAATGRLRPPAKASWYPASLVGILDGPFRGRELSLVPGQTSPAAAAAPRPRKRSATCFEPSEASETFSGVFWSFPTRRKRSAARFDVFRGLGRGANMRHRAFPAHPAYLCRRLSGIGMRCERSDTMSGYYLLLRDYSNYYLYGITVWNRRASQRGKVDLV